MKLLRNNKPMVATLISGILILLGFVLQTQNVYPLSIIVFILSFLIGGYHQAVEGVRDTIETKRLNVDILMVLAAVGASIIGYWLEGALLIFIFSLSGSMEEYATNKSTEAISSLLNVVPTTAKRYKKDGSIETIAVKDLSIGDKLLVSKGDSIPIDGDIISGRALIDESAITGESIPSEKAINDSVFGSTINLFEPIVIKVTKDSEDTLFAKIIRMVEEAQSTPSHTASFINRIENKYVIIVLTFVPVMIAIFYFGLQWGWNESFYRGMVLLTVASPCALVASATPAALSAISNTAKKGILFKGGIAIENIGQIDCIAFDKTGTLTEGKLRVTEHFIDSKLEREFVLGVVEELEHRSTHPIATALMNYVDTQQHRKVFMEDIQDVTGFGLSGKVDGGTWRIGKGDFVLGNASVKKEFLEEVTYLQEDGKTVIFVSRNDQVVAYFALLDTPKEDGKEMVAFFRSQGVHTILITGDNESTARTIAELVGVDEYHANCLPQEKTEIVKNLQKTYKTVAMVGDGVNDAPALANADIGIAIGEGTDIAMETADIILMKNNLSLLTYSYELSKKLKKITMQNIIFSLSVIVILIISNLFQVINLPIGVIGHEGSTILVILNGLRMLIPLKVNGMNEESTKQVRSEKIMNL